MILARVKPIYGGARNCGWSSGSARRTSRCRTQPQKTLALFPLGRLRLGRPPRRSALSFTNSQPFGNGREDVRENDFAQTRSTDSS